MFRLAKSWLRGGALSGALVVTVVLNGGPSPYPAAKSPAPTLAPPQTEIVCPYGYFAGNGFCHPYSWYLVTEPF